MKVKEIIELIDFISRKKLEEVKVETAEIKLSVKKTGGSRVIEQQVFSSSPMTVAAPAPQVSATPAASSEKTDVETPAPVASNNLFDNDLSVGNKVEHSRFGKGEIIKIEGVGNDKKAEIRFESGGMKKLLLRFARLQVIG